MLIVAMPQASTIPLRYRNGVRVVGTVTVSTKNELKDKPNYVVVVKRVYVSTKNELKDKPNYVVVVKRVYVSTKNELKGDT